MSRRKPRRVTVSIEQLLASSIDLQKLHAIAENNGHAVKSARLWRCRDGSYTARVVWRKRDAILSTFTCIVRGVLLA